MTVLNFSKNIKSHMYAAYITPQCPGSSLIRLKQKHALQRVET